MMNKGDLQSYNSEEFWNSHHSINEVVSDESTLNPLLDFDPRAFYHYNQVENLILEHIHEEFKEEEKPNYKTTEWSALDIGCGAGHWVDFLLSLRVKSVIGMDISKKCIQSLKNNKYKDEVVSLSVGNVVDMNYQKEFNVVTAIGVMFHIVDDSKWKEGVRNIGRSLTGGGVAYIGGEFGSNTYNSQYHTKDDFSTIDERDLGGESSMVNKRLRSLNLWTEVINEAGCVVESIKRTSKHEDIPTPENNILIVRKK